MRTLKPGELKKVCEGIDKKRPTVKGKRPWCLSFPSLDECRNQFEKKVKIPEFDWD